MKNIYLLFFSLFISLFANSTIITVLNTNDSGTGSLREAIVNSAIDGDTIIFNNNIISSGNATLTLLSEIGFSKSLTIKGLYNSTDTLFISGNNNSRIFEITNTTNVTLDSLVLINGNGAGTTLNGRGGALIFYDSDSLIITNSIIKDNMSDYGGGAYFHFSTNSTVNYAEYAYVEINNCTFQNNASTADAGAIGYFASSTILTNIFPTLTIINSTVNNNQAEVSRDGGGIHFSVFTMNTTSASSYPILNITRTTINGNTALVGAGIYCIAYSDKSAYFNVNVNYSTITNNIAGDIGGGIYNKTVVTNYVPASYVNIKSSTISGNSSINEGGGVYNQAITFNTTYNATAQINCESSIIALNGNSNLFVDNSNTSTPTTVTSQGYNIFSDTPTGANSTGDQININASLLNLGNLAFNGGATQTLKPLSGSVAIDMGQPSDLNNAQNGAIYGIRDVGAAESACILTGIHNETICYGESIIVNGTVYDANNLNGTETFTNIGPNGCDSIVTVDISVESQIDVSTSLTNGLIISANENSATYQWINCDNGNSQINGETNQTFTPSTNGNYAVIIFVNGCSDTSDCVSVSTIGLNENNDDLIKIYNQQNLVTVNNNFSNPYSITVYDLSGKIVYQKEQINTSLFQFEVNTPNQILIVKIKSNGFIKTEKINLNH